MKNNNNVTPTICCALSVSECIFLGNKTGLQEEKKNCMN